MLKLKLQYFGHLMWRTDSLEKTLMLGKIEGRRRGGWQRMRCLDGVTDSMGMSLSKLWEMIMDKPGVLQSRGLQRVGHDWTTENWTDWGSSVHGISQVRILEWVAIFFSRRSSALAGRFFTTEPPGKPLSVHWSKIKSQRQSFGCSRKFSSVQFSSVAQSCPTLYNPMDCSTPGFPVHHQLLESA